MQQTLDTTHSRLNAGGIAGAMIQAAVEAGAIPLLSSQVKFL